jgi:alkyl hydroperoxide reductase subunit AhpC
MSFKHLFFQARSYSNLGTNHLTLSFTVQKVAPEWTTKAVMRDEIKTISSTDFHNKYYVLFFYPLDLYATLTLVVDSTFVCPTEILAFNSRLPAFREINTDVLACSIDSEYAHLAWSRLAKKSGGLGGPLDLPLLSDVKRELSDKFGVLTDSGVALRYSMVIHFSR